MPPITSRARLLWGRANLLGWRRSPAENHLGLDQLSDRQLQRGGLRIARSDLWTGTHHFAWGPGGILADSSGSTTYTPGFSQRQGSTARFSHSDWLGSTRYLSDSTGNSFPAALRFDAFGGRSATGGTNPYDPSAFQFAGGAAYETECASGTEPGVGLQLLGNRCHDPALGRLVSSYPRNERGCG